MLRSTDILLFGADAITEGEAATIAASDLAVMRLAEVRADRGAAIDKVATWASRF